MQSHFQKTCQTSPLLKKGMQANSSKYAQLKQKTNPDSAAALPPGKATLTEWEKQKEG